MCPKAKEYLKELKKTCTNGVVAMAEIDDGELLLVVSLPNGDKAKIERVGEVKVRLNDGQVRSFGDVIYIPNICRNLISLGRLDGLGCTIQVKNGVLEVTKKGKVILKGNKGKTNLFTFDGRCVEDGLVQANVLSNEGEVLLNEG
ncbi:uncharacterized protein LOC141630273 [Silene latifolia]|uniref:uncharacterized protein LOC141630273 n=1 Tax=Silene latifolia TaxID=37657 RepID=UPI003D788440